MGLAHRQSERYLERCEISLQNSLADHRRLAAISINSHTGASTGLLRRRNGQEDAR